MAKRFTPAVTRVNMTRMRAVFKFALDERLISQPVFYGRGYDGPKKAAIRKARHKKPKTLFCPDQIKLLMDCASPTLKAMILLATNIGMNNAHLGNMEFRHIDLRSGWLDYPRHKTGVERRAPLWPETVRLFHDYFEVRQRPLEQFDDFVFITKSRKAWHSHTSLPAESRKLREAVNIDYRDDKLKELDPPPIPHGTFGYFRHTFETVAGGCRDQVAVNAIMGHVDDSVAAEYREGIEEDRLEDVTHQLRMWLFGKRVAK